MTAVFDSGRISAALSPSIVYVIDDDAALRDALSSLFRSVGLQVELFASARESCKANCRTTPSCLVLDIRLPGVSGLDFQAELPGRHHMPIVFMTGHGDIPMSVRAMKAGAVDFLTKPFRDQDMLDAVLAALERDRTRRETDQATAAGLRAAYRHADAARAGDHGVRDGGLMNKQIAGEIGVERDHREDPPRPRHAQNGSANPGRSRPDRGATQPFSHR